MSCVHDEVGNLNSIKVLTGYQVTPVVGFIQPGFTLSPDPFEVADVFEVPLTFLLNEASRRIGSHVHDGLCRRYYVFEYAGHRIWGATAGMLVNLQRRIAVHGEAGGFRGSWRV